MYIESAEKYFQENCGYIFEEIIKAERFKA